MRIESAALVLCLLVSCGEGPKPEAKEFRLPDLPRPIADDVRFPSAKRVAIRVEEKNLLGLAFLSGGNIATYKAGSKEYRFFTIRCRAAQQAGGYLFDIKSQLKDPKFVASYGGYFSDSVAGGLFVFAKGNYVAGIAGLTEDEAIQTGKDFAARL